MGAVRVAAAVPTVHKTECRFADRDRPFYAIAAVIMLIFTASGFRRFYRVLMYALALPACGMALAQRLPGGASPDHYTLQFTIHFANNTFDGDESIDLKLDRPTRTITLNAVEIAFHEVEVKCAGQLQTAKVSTDEKNEMATFTVDLQLPPGPCAVHINYTGQLNNKLRGLYLSNYNGRKYAISQMEAVDARVAFPSFDQPEYKATFDISATVDKGDTAISNNQEISDNPGPGLDQHTIKFATSPKMSTYLVALTVGDWKCSSDSVNGIKLRVCTVPGKENLTHYPLEATKAILQYYNDYYGIKYPLSKLDLIAAPDFQAGAMENWGAIIYRETALLIDEKTASVGAKKVVAQVIAHEVAHQWFGDLVTMKWWDDIWLNEGFATWMTPHPLENWQPEWHVSQDIVENTMDSLATDSSKNTRPIHQQAEIRGEIESLFDGIAYGKTAAVLHMLESYLGHETFRTGVNLYLKEHAYGSATASDFWSAMARSSNKPIDKIMPTFVMQAGEPYLDVETKCDGGNSSLDLSQKRYINNPAGFNESNEQVWQIPLRVKRIGSESKEQTFLLTQRKQQFTMQGCAPFVFPNAGALGYYRFNYDTAALRRLGKAAEDGLTAEERIALIGDEWALMRAGLHSVGDYLALGEQLRNTPGSVLLSNFIGHLAYISQILVTDANRPQFEAWVGRTFSPLLQQVGYTSKPNDTPELKEKRAVLYTVLGNIGNDPKAVEQARSIAQEYVKDSNSVDGTLANAVIAVAARHGNPALYAQFKAKLKEQGMSPEEYYLFFYALAEFPQSDLIQQTLNWTLTPEVRGQDIYLLLNVLGNPNGETQTWDFMRSHYDDIVKKSGGGLGGAGIFQYAVQGFCDAQKRVQVEQFFQQHPMPGTERVQKDSIETISSCISLRDQQSPKLAAWLQQNGTMIASEGNIPASSNRGMRSESR